MNIKELYFEDGTIIPKHILYYLNNLNIEVYPRKYIGSFEKTVEGEGQILINKYLAAFYRDGQLLDYVHRDNTRKIVINDPVYEYVKIISLQDEEIIEYRKYDGKLKKNCYIREVESWEVKTFVGEDTLCLCLDNGSRRQIFIGCDKYYNIEIFLDYNAGLMNKRSGEKYIITKNNQYTPREIVMGIASKIDEYKIKNPRILELFKLMICDPRVGDMICLLMNKLSKLEDDLYIIEERKRIQATFDGELARLENEKKAIDKINQSSSNYEYGLIPAHEIEFQKTSKGK